MWVRFPPPAHLSSEPNQNDLVRFLAMFRFEGKEKVKNILLTCVEEQKGALKSPKPFVLFEDFGDSALIFTVNFYLNDSFIDPKIKSEIRFRIDRMFRENNISIPFPQRDVHIYQSSPNK